MTTQFAYKNIVQPRDDHFALNPVTGAVEQFLLLERTHYWTQAGSTNWIDGANAGLLTFATVDSRVIAGPDGNNNALLISATTQTVYHGYRAIPLGNNGDFQGVPADAVNRQWGFQHILKAGTISQFDIVYTNGSGVVETHRFDLSTGLKVSGPNTSVRVAPVAPGNPTYAGWYRIYSVGIRFGAAVDRISFVRMVKAGNQNFTGALTDNFYVAGQTSEYNVGICSPIFTSIPVGWGWGASPGEDQLCIALPTEVQEPKPLTVYMEWLDLGNAIMAAAIANARTPGIFRIGNLENTGNNFVRVTQTATGFTGVYNVNGATSTSDVTITVDAEQLVTLRAIINGAGALTIHASVNGGGEVAGTTGTAIGFASAWGGNFITPNAHGLSNTGDMALRKLHVLPGTVSLTALRIL